MRRYEHDKPGELVHVDIKKLGRIPDGGGHRVVDRRTGERNAKNTTTARRRDGKPVIGWCYLHTALDDHSRLAYTEILSDERKQTAVGFWTRAQAFFTAAGIRVARVLTDNGSCYRSRLWRDTLHTAGITHKRTRPYRPQTALLRWAGVAKRGPAGRPAQTASASSVNAVARRSCAGTSVASS